MATVMIIPAKKQMGNTIKKPEEKSCALQPTAASAQILMSRKPAMKRRFLTTKNISAIILNGSLPAFSPMTAFQAQTPKSVKNLIV